MAAIRSWDERDNHYRGFSARAFESPSRTVTRPANTTQYTAGDEFGDGTALIFGTAATYNGGGGIITHAVAVSSVNQATKPNQRLYILSGSPAMAGDNATWAPAFATLGSVVAMAELSSWEVGGTGSGTAGNCFAIAQINKKYRCASGDSKLYGVLVERGTYTPISAENLTVTLYGEYD